MTKPVHAQKTEDRIKRAALEMFSSQGFQATGVRDIARQADVTVATLYHYMTSKEDLLVAIMRSNMRELISAAEVAILNGRSPREQLHGVIEQHVRSHGQRRQHSTVGDTELRSLAGKNREDILSLRDQYEQLWDGVIREGVVLGEFHVSDVRLATFALIEMCNGVARWYRPFGRLRLDEVAAHYAAMGLRMVCVSPFTETLQEPLAIGDVSDLHS